MLLMRLAGWPCQTDLAQPNRPELSHTAVPADGPHSPPFVAVGVAQWADFLQIGVPQGICTRHLTLLRRIEARRR